MITIKDSIWHLIIDVAYGPSDYHKRKHLWYDDRCIEPRRKAPFDHEKYIEKETKSLYANIDNVLGRLKLVFPACKIFVFAALYRKNWFPEIREMASKVNQYMRTKHGATICQLNGFVSKVHMEVDKIHLNKEGYKLFMSKCVGPMFDSYHAVVKPEVKVEVPPNFYSLPKTQRRRLAKRLRRQLNTNI